MPAWSDTDWTGAKPSTALYKHGEESLPLNMPTPQPAAAPTGEPPKNYNGCCRSTWFLTPITGSCSNMKRRLPRQLQHLRIRLLL